MLQKRTRKVLALMLSAVLALSLLGVGGCAAQDDPEVEDEDVATGTTETITIGVQTALTGPLPDYGLAARVGCELAAEDFSGFTIGDTTYEIELLVLDDKAEPAEAAIVAQTMVDADVVGVIGGLTTGATTNAMPIYFENRIPQISGSVTGPKANENEFDTFFRTCWNDSVQGEALAVWAMELGAEKVTLMDDNDAYAVGLADAAQAVLDAAGIETDRQNCQSGDQSFTAQISNIREFGAEAVIFTGYHPEASLLRKQMVEAGLEDVIFMGGDGIRSDEFIGQAGGAANADGVYATFGSFSEDDQPGYSEFAEKYRAATDGDEPGPYAQNNYDALGALVAAIVEAQSLDAEDILAALGTLEYNGVTGIFGFAAEADADSQIARGDIVVAGLEPANVPRYVISGGAWVPAE